MRALPRSAQVYVCAVAALAVGIVAQAATRTLDWHSVAVLAVLFAVSESTSTMLTRRTVYVSISFSVGLASVIIAGPFGAAVVASSGAFALRRGGLPLVKRVFNGAQYVISAFAAGLVYKLVNGMAAGPLTPEPVTSNFPWLVVPFTAAVLTFCVLNAIMLACVLWLSEGVHPFRVWSGVLAQSVLPYLGYGMFGPLIAALWVSVGPLAAPLVLVPLFVARWAFAQYAAEQSAYDETIAALCQAVETKDYYTRGHSDRVARASVMIARETGMCEERVRALHYAGMLHDVGKLGVPTEVLEKSGSLSDEEFATIQLHPMRGLDIVGEIEFLHEARAGIAHHHERIDGSGYPMGLAGSAIPEFARVIAVADAFDSMTSTRSYRKARSVAEALGELRTWAGSQFDGGKVEALVRAVGKYGWDPPAPRPARGDDVVFYDHDDPALPLGRIPAEPPPDPAELPVHAYRGTARP
jgi:hypothetical protein